MIYNISYRPVKVMDKIDSQVGASFNLLERVRMNGTGSPRLLVDEFCEDIKKKIAFSADLNYTNIELRKRGIIIYFKNRSIVWAFAIAYHHLTIYQNGSIWSFHSNGRYVKVHCTSSEISLKNFIFKLMRLKNKHCGHQIDHGTGS